MRRSGIITFVSSAALSSACVAPAASEVPRLPSWLHERTRTVEELRLSQNVSRDGEYLEVCRTLTNMSSSNMALVRIEPRGNAYGQLLTYMLDEAGNPIAPNDNVFHPTIQPPPEIDQSPSGNLQTLSPGMRISNCNRLRLPREPSHLWVVSTYDPQVGAHEFPASLPSTTVVISREYGFVRSNLCEISGRRIRCLGGDQ
jgi:hypothetical protein